MDADNTMDSSITTKRFRWSETMSSALLKTVHEYKSLKEFEGIDFEADLVKFYGDIRESMAEGYPDDFGPVCVVAAPITSVATFPQKKYNLTLKQQSKDIKSGYLKIKEKIKNIRQAFKKALNEGTRSGAGKLVIENWDLLKDIWGHCPSVNKIPGAVNSIVESDEDEDEDFAVVPITVESEVAEVVEVTSENKRMGTPQFVDNKRKKLEKKNIYTKRTFLITHCY